LKLHLEKLHAEHQAVLDENHSGYTMMMEKEAEGARLHRETFIMQRHLKTQAQKATVNPALPQHVPILTITPPSPNEEKRQRHTSKYGRYFKEKETWERIGIAKAKWTNEKIKENIQPILNGISELSVVHEELRKQIGVETSEEIEDLADFSKEDDAELRKPSKVPPL
jgi:hypothetical protein